MTILLAVGISLKDHAGSDDVLVLHKLYCKVHLNRYSSQNMYAIFGCVHISQVKMSCYNRIHTT